MNSSKLQRLFILISVAASLSLLSLRAHAAASDIVISANTQARLIGDHIQVGKPFWIALQMKMDPHWHTYWRNPGDSGIPVSIEWKLPQGYSAGPIQWPYPNRMDEAGLTTYGYEGTVYLVTKFTPSENLKAGENVPIGAKVQWLACEKMCVPGEADLSLELPVKENKNRPWEPYQFTSETFNVPVKSSIWKVTAQDNGEHLILSFKTPKGTPLNYIPPTGPVPYSLKQVDFFPYKKDIIQNSAGQKVIQDGKNYKLILTKSELAPAKLKKLDGILVNKSGWGGEDQRPAWEIDLPVTFDETASIEAKKDFVAPILGISESELFDKPIGTSMNVWLAVAFAFLGGIILNLMPCVLPVLSIKILTLLEHKDDKVKAMQSGLVFSLGVLTSFWILAGALILLKATGEQIGWGFQFQSPAFIIFLSSLLFAMALNLFGVFEVGASLLSIESKVKEKGGFKGSFMSGVLATVVATPCTAPFMGTAIGFALAQPAFVALLIFSALGLGMASPYLILSFFPQFLRFLPKPGRWMIVLKKFLGVLLLLTVFWLAWVLGLQKGNTAVIFLAVGLLVVGLGCLIYGKWSLPSQTIDKRILARFVTGLLLIVGLFIAFMGVGKESKKIVPVAKTQSSTGIDWQDYSPELVKKLRQKRQPIFIDFTAAWCLSCQVNERVTFHDAKVIKKFKETGIVPIKADWTTRDEKITKALEKFGKNSIPLYVIYTKDPKQPPILLPEIITPNIVIEELDKIEKK